jgi:hypothetical protein
MVEQHHLRQFLLFVFALLIPSFVLWTLVSASLAVPAIGLVNMMLTAWFPDVVQGLYADGVEALLMTEFGELNGKLVSLKEAEYRLGFKVNTGILSYSLPFYTALHFATEKQVYLEKYLGGLLILYMLFVFGLLCLCLKELMVNLGTVFLDQPGTFVPHANVIAVLYQFNVLVVPTLAPVVLWAWQARHTPLMKDAFSLGGTDIDC